MEDFPASHVWLPAGKQQEVLISPKTLELQKTTFVV
jgi:hypothetical protein